MKKILSIIAAAALITASAQSALAYTSYRYSASGLMKSVSRAQNEGGFSAIECPGAVVDCDYDIFDRVVIRNKNVGDGLYYSCYGSSSSLDTLTLGLVDHTSILESKRSVLQRCVANQIRYINSIGGEMTGYTFENDGNEALNISWNVGGMHHYARFERDFTGGAVGYYDLMYSDNSASQNLIPSMNSSFGVVYEGQ